MTRTEPDGTEHRPDGVTPSQTVGPFFAYCLTPSRYGPPGPFSDDLVSGGAPGERIEITGRLLDGDGAPVAEAIIEIWQADGFGRYPGHDAEPTNSGFRGFGRAECDGEGRFRFVTVKPGQVAASIAASRPGARQAPHVTVGIFARGLLRQLHTRVYFADEAAANAADPVLALVPAERRPTLIAQRTSGPDGPVYRFDIRLQGGDDETVFFEA